MTDLPLSDDRDVPDYADGRGLLARAPRPGPVRSATMRVAVAGAGAVGRSIARELLLNDHRVTLLDKRGDDLDHDKVPGADWITCDACELSHLEELGLADFDVVVAATGDDKANLVVSLLAKTEFAVPRVVARVNDPRNEWLFDESWGVDVAVSTPRLLVSLVEEAVSVGDVVRLLTLRRGGANIVGVTLPDQTPLAGRPVSRVEFPRDAVLVAILRGGRVIVPEPDVPFEAGDELLVVASEDAEAGLRDAVLGG
jgi:trk system potassium uptake protein TrkA